MAKRTKSSKKKQQPKEQGFATLGLSDAMLSALKDANYSAPTPVQAGVIPLALEGLDVLGQAQTGTGKTAAFSIPILEQLRSSRTRGPQALVLVPTRELAVQVSDELKKLSKGRRTRTLAVYGGKPIRGQIEKLKKGVDVLVGTPGRVLDHMGRRSLTLDDIECAVLDEADRMLDIGFRPDIERILRKCPSDRQTLLLSATMPTAIQRIADRFMVDPERINFSPKNLAVETIDQFYFTVVPQRKFDLLVRLLVREQPKQSIVFCRTKRGTEKIMRRLQKRTKSVDCLHGDMAQNVRDRVMKGFRSEKFRVLVATDVIGRGIDVSGISHIINYDIPTFCDDYVHRVGRTGRMGREGVAYTFVTPEEGHELTRIEQRINKQLMRDEIKGFDPLAETKRVVENKEPPPPPPPSNRSRTRRYRRGV